MRKTAIILAILSALIGACSEQGVCGFPAPYLELAVDLPVPQAEQFSAAITELDVVRGGRQDVLSDMLVPPQFTPPRIRITLTSGTDRDAVREAVKRVAESFGGEGVIKGVTFVLERNPPSDG